MRHPDRRPPEPVGRRDFVKAATAVSAAALARPLPPMTGQSGQPAWHQVPCRFCGVGCGLLVRVDNGRAVAVKGDPASPVNRGLACAKGYYSIQALYGRDRITRAHLRRNGALAPVPMAEALDEIAARLRDAIQRFGPDSVALYGSAQWTAADAFVGERLFRGAIGSRNVDTSERLYTASADVGHVAAYGLPGPPGSFEDLDHADVFVLWNVNLAETDPVLFSRLLERRRVTPSVRIIDLGTRTTRTSYAADRALLLVPNSELAVANAICQDIIARGRMNREFLERHVAFKRGDAKIGDGDDDVLTADQGADVRFEDFVRFLGAMPPDRATEVSGLAIEDVRWLSSLYADPARKVVSLWGNGVNQQARGTWVNSAIHNIHLLVGKVATPGNAAMPVTGQPGGASLVRAGLAQADGGERPRAAPRPALSIFRALERGDIRFLWIQATNPMVSLPNLSRFRAAAKKAGHYLVVSEAYPTPTTDVAHAVLPSAMWLERDGTFCSVERRVQYFSRLLRAPGDCLGDAQQMLEVARRLGHTALVPSGASGEDPVWSELRRRQERAALPSHSTLQRGAGALWPAPGDQETRWRYNSRFDPAANRALGAFDFYGHPDHRAWIWLRPHEAPPESPDRDYPFWFMADSVVEHWGRGSMTRRIPSLHRAVPQGFVELNLSDARGLGIRDGDRVRLTSRRGTVEAEARVEYRNQLPRGRVLAPGFDEGVAVNLLTPDASCPLSGQPAYGACAVRVERVRRAP